MRNHGNKDVCDNGGSGLLTNKYNSSIYSLLCAIYPDFDWIPWNFSVVPKYFWDDENNQKKFLDWAGNKLGIKEMDGWYNVTQKVYKFGGKKVYIR